MPTIRMIPRGIISTLSTNSIHIIGMIPAQITHLLLPVLTFQANE